MPTISATPQTVLLHEGVSNNVVVATFTDTDPSPVNDYSVSINWGDQSALDTTSARVSLSGSTYFVTASHTYAEETPTGTPNAVTVTIQETNGADTDMATVNSSANVADNSLTANGQTITGTEGLSSSPYLMATFTDADPNGTVTDYSAIIKWGDGTLSVGTVRAGTGGTFNVSARHNYGEGTYSYTVTILDAGGAHAEASGTASISDRPVTPTGGFTVSALENKDSASQTVATFKDPGSIEGLKNYSANIDWGDGSTSLGVITFNTKGAVYTVAGHHLYAEEGSYDVTVTIHHDTAPDAQTVSTAQVADVAVNGTGSFTFTGVEGSNSASRTVATFTDPGGVEPLADYSATIAWGDGSTSAGTIAFDSATSTFTVTGSHAYAEEGNSTITITLKHDSAPNVVVTSSAQVSDPAVNGAGGFTVTATEGSNFGSQTVATFTDPGGAEPVADYSASIAWGDGSTSAGTVAFNTTTATFAVSGSHIYAEEGNAPITVTIHHDAAPDVTVTSTAQVSDPAVNATGGFTVKANEGQDSGSQTVATFTDPGGAEALTNYSANIDWGDGSTSAAVITFNSVTGVFTVSGSHTYSEEGGYGLTITIHHDAAPDAVVDSTATVSPLQATGGFTVTATEGSNSGAQTVATFTDPAGPEPVANYSATIAWGDGLTSAGTITFNSTNSTFTVTGSHTYAEEGNPTITVTIRRDSAPGVTATSAAQVGDPAVIATGGFTVNSFEGSNSSNQTVATFTDPAGSEPVGNYSASIAWGDGSTSAGTVAFDTATSTFAVSGSHMYAEEGNPIITVTIHHDAAPDATVTSTARIFDLAVEATGGFTVNGSEGGSSGSQTVATFTDPGGAEPAANYSASINWGDGSTSSGTISFNSTTGVFTVSGTHTYAEEGTDTITVSIHHDASAAVSVSSTAQVTDQAVAATGGFTVTAAEGSNSGNQTVATFTDPAGPEALSNYSATISWGDGSTSSGTITFNTSTGVFTVSGSHAYAEEGTDTISVTVHHDTAPDVTVINTAEVADVAVLATGGFTLKAGEGSSTGAQTVATFTDPAGAEPVANYSASISWGDESSSAGTITFNSGTGIFTVAGSHSYAEQGTFTITVTIQHETAPAATATSTALIRVRSDIAGRINQNGDWWVGTSNGSTAFSNSHWATWDPRHTWVDVLTGDFNGDGRTDYVGRDAQTGQVWVALSTGSGFTTTLWTTWAANVTWADVKVGDFTGDGKDDLVGRVAENGQIWVATSTGSSFTNTLWATWYSVPTWVDTQVGDFTGDGKADITSRDLASGAWWTGVSTGSSFTTTLWGAWDPSVTWVDVRVGDFTGDGKADIVGRVQQYGQIWVGQSTGSSFINSLWTTWAPRITWTDVLVGDFNGDGKADLVGRVGSNGQIWVAKSTGSSFTNTLWATWDPTRTWVDVQVGDYNGDGNADLAGRDLASGAWWVGLSNGSTAFTTTLWTVWAPGVTWANVHSGDFA